MYLFSVVRGKSVKNFYPFSFSINFQQINLCMLKTLFARLYNAIYICALIKNNKYE